MEKIKAKHVLLALAALLVLGFIVSPGFGAALVLVYLFAGLIWLIVMSCKAAKRKYSRRNKPKETVKNSTPAQRQAQTAPMQQPTPPPERKAPPASLPYSFNGLERRYHYKDVNVYMPNPQAMDMQGLEVGAEVMLWQEKTNQYDNKAVAVIFGGYIIAYLHKGKLQDMANDWINAGKPVLAMVYSKAPTGLQISLAFYDLPKLERLMQKDPSPRAYKLTRTGSKAVKEALDGCWEGFELDLEEDDEGKIKVLYIDEPIGYLPARAVELVEDYGGPEWCSVFLAGKDEDENLKITASVYIFRGK